MDEINLVASVSETHNRANMGMSPADSIAGFARIMDSMRGAPVSTNATVATAFGCPFEGDQPSTGSSRRWSATCRSASTG